MPEHFVDHATLEDELREVVNEMRNLLRDVLAELQAQRGAVLEVEERVGEVLPDLTEATMLEERTCPGWGADPVAAGEAVVPEQCAGCPYDPGAPISPATTGCYVFVRRPVGRVCGLRGEGEG